MTATDKQNLASFINLSNDFIGSGYKSRERKYHFDDDTLKQSPEIEVDNDSVEQIALEIKNCENCPLCKTRTNTAPGEGVYEPLVMVIGEGPGQEEDAQGRPFVGKAGQLLDKMLASIDLSRETNCFIANVVKCRPPNNRAPYPEETAACAHFLERQVTVLKPRFILAVGKSAAQALLKTTAPITKLRGKLTNLRFRNETFPFIATFHPAALLRNEEWKRPAWEDLKLLRSQIDKIHTKTYREN